MTDTMPAPIWRCIRVACEDRTKSGKDGRPDEACGIASEMFQSSGIAYEVRSVQNESALSIQVSVIVELTAIVVQLVDLEQPTVEELAGKVEAQQAAFVYLHAQDLGLTSEKIPKLEGSFSENGLLSDLNPEVSLLQSDLSCHCCYRSGTARSVCRLCQEPGCRAVCTPDSLHRCSTTTRHRYN